MKLYEFISLIELRLPVLQDKYANIIARILSSDKSRKRISGGGEPAFKEEPEYWEKEARAFINQMFEADPTPNGKYTQWILLQYGKKRFVYEDAGQIGELISFFHENKRHFDEKDINRYDVETLWRELGIVRQKLADGDEESGKQKEKRLKKGATKVLDTTNALVIRPDTPEAACYYGAGTRWCTVSHDPEQARRIFQHYTKPGNPGDGSDKNLYIIIDKKNNEKYQLHFGTRQIMDAEDKSVAPVKFAKMFPEVFKFFEEKFENAFVSIMSAERMKTLSYRQLEDILFGQEMVDMIDDAEWHDGDDYSKVRYLWNTLDDTFFELMHEADYYNLWKAIKNGWEDSEMEDELSQADTVAPLLYLSYFYWLVEQLILTGRLDNNFRGEAESIVRDIRYLAQKYLSGDLLRWFDVE